MLNAAREQISFLNDYQLAQLWTEVVDWETSGVLPEDALLRDLTRKCFPSEVMRPRINVANLSMVASELWRAAARALCDPEASTELLDAVCPEGWT